jgi:hypothetical protein
MPPFPPSNSAATPPTTPVIVDSGMTAEIAPPSPIIDLRAIANDDPPANVEVTLTEHSPRSRQRGPRAQTAIGRALLRNTAEIDVLAISLVGSINEWLASLKNERFNSDEARGANEKTINELETLRRRVEIFIESKVGFAAKKVSEKAVVEATSELTTQTSWLVKHDSEVTRFGFFGAYLALCLLAGWPTAALAAALALGGEHSSKILDSIAKVLKVTNKPPSSPDDAA